MLPPETLGLYENSLMEEYLAIVGKRVFVAYYFELKDGTARLEGIGSRSAALRIRQAREIFRNDFHVAALKRIIASKHLPPEIIERAKDLYLYETLSLKEYYLSLD